MANYPGATEPFPALDELRRDFGDQTESERFRNVTDNLCEKTNLSIEELVGFTLGYLHGRKPTGIEDLAEFMRRLIAVYHLDYQPDSPELYEAVKGIPAHSSGRMGYTFRRGKGRRPEGVERGVFLFLR